MTLSLLLGDYQGIQKSYKIPPSGFTENQEYVDKSKILQEFIPKNKELRQKDNILSDNYYDNIVNECIVDAVNEIVEKER